MAISRYNKRPIIVNRSYDYLFSPIFRNRKIFKLTQYTIANLKFPTIDEIMDLEIETKVWTAGEKYFKLAHEYYGNSEYWWIIAWYNKKPLETDFKGGEVVEIPMPLEIILEYLDIY
jgi:hypothetical protein